MGLSLADAQFERLQSYIRLLEKWNRQINLISRSDIARLIERHILDSLSALHLLDTGPVLDVGSGAGLPGIPLAIACEDLEFMLCERMQRRTRFLHQVCMQLPLTNVQVSAEDIDGWPGEGKFKTVVARAVAPADVLWPRIAPHLADDGSMLVYAATREDASTSELEPQRSEQPESEADKVNDSYVAADIDDQRDVGASAELDAWASAQGLRLTVHHVDVPGSDHTHTLYQVHRDG